MDVHRGPGLRRLCLALDALLVVVAMFGAFGAHEALIGLVPGVRAPPPPSQFLALAWITLPLWLALVAAFDLHTVLERPWTLTKTFLATVKLHAAAIVAISLVLFFTHIVINRSLVALFLAWSFVLTLAERRLLAGWQRFQYASGRGQRVVLLVGGDVVAMREYVAAAARREWPPRIAGWLGPEAVAAAADLEPTPRPGTSLPPLGPLPDRLGDIGDVEPVLARETVDDVVFFPPFADRSALDAAVHAGETRGLALHFGVDLPRRRELPPQMAIVGGRPFVVLERAPKSPALLALKHGLDVVVAAVALVFLAPALATIALAVLVTSGRPVLFSQERAGLHGRRFHVLKFRTMHRDAARALADVASSNETGGPTFKMRGDPRVTRLGRFLRSTSLDELPQLFNVLVGSMSLVGPRPLPSDEQQRIEGWHRRRLAMKPGMTGLWQVSGRSDVPFARWMELDLEYVDEWSLPLDAKIVLRTIPAVISRRGAR